MKEVNTNYICIHCNQDFSYKNNCGHYPGSKSALNNYNFIPILPKICPVCLSRLYAFVSTSFRLEVLCSNTACLGYFVRLNGKQTILKISHNNRLFYTANIEHNSVLKISCLMNFRQEVNLDTDNYIYRLFFSIIRSHNFDILKENNNIRFIKICDS